MIAVFDIGGTSIKLGVIEEQQPFSFVYKEELASDAKACKGPGILARVIDKIQQLRKSYSLQGVGISTAGMVDARTGSIVYANENIPEYTGICIKQEVEQATGLTCWVENDVNAAALAEAMYGAGKAVKDSIMLTIGTGIGGALVLDHAIYHGHSISAGEIGYMMICGKPYQDIASTTALVERVQELTGEQKLTGRIIFERAKQGDNICKQEIECLCDIIMQGVTNCICLLNPEMVILGGGIMSQSAYLLPFIEANAQRYLIPSMRSHTQIAFALLGNDAGMVGAYVNYMQREGEQYA